MIQMDTQENVDVDWDRMMLTDNEGREHKMCPHEYWYLAPTRTNWSPEDQSIPPLHFGLLLHNARCGQGIAPAMQDLMQGITPVSMKIGLPKKAEEMFEKVRNDRFGDRPSRLRCHFLSYDKGVAETRQAEWNLHDRRLVKCYALLSSAKFHFADIRLYEEAAMGNLSEAIAERYWEDYDKAVTPREHVEVLADAAMYFPDWREFDELSAADLTNWNEIVGPKLRRQEQSG